MGGREGKEGNGIQGRKTGREVRFKGNANKVYFHEASYQF